MVAQESLNKKSLPQPEPPDQGVGMRLPTLKNSQPLLRHNCFPMVLQVGDAGYPGCPFQESSSLSRNHVSPGVTPHPFHIVHTLHDLHQSLTDFFQPKQKY